MPSLQQTLADTTRSLHNRIEDNPLMHAMHNGDSLEHPYRWILSKLYPFAKESEEKISALLGDQEGFDIARRRRIHLLHDDLADLGLTPAVYDTTLFDVIDTPDKAIGLLYVLEGSRKGGAFLSALLQKKAPHLPVRYLVGYGAATGIEWEQFCLLLERYAHTPMQHDIIAGALSAFEILERIFHDERY